MSQQPRETSKAIVAYPAMPESDYELIRALREKHFHRQPYKIHPDLERPRFILHEGKSMDAKQLIEGIEANLNDFYAFDFIIHYSILLPVLHGYSIAFVPMQGLNDFSRLQSIIHLNILRNYTSPFSHLTPHIHIAWCVPFAEAKARMNHINQHEIEIKGRIDKLSIQEHQKGAIPVIHEFPLKSR